MKSFLTTSWPYFKSDLPCATGDSELYCCFKSCHLFLFVKYVMEVSTLFYGVKICLFQPFHSMSLNHIHTKWHFCHDRGRMVGVKSIKVAIYTACFNVCIVCLIYV